VGRWVQSKLLVAVVGGLLAIGGEVAQAEIGASAPSINCTARNLQIIQEVKSDPGIVSVLPRQHDGLDGSCGPAAKIAQTVLSNLRR
jgi:hypothetical protein